MTSCRLATSPPSHAVTGAGFLTRRGGVRALAARGLADEHSVNHLAGSAHAARRQSLEVAAAPPRAGSSELRTIDQLLHEVDVPGLAPETCFIHFTRSRGGDGGDHWPDTRTCTPNGSPRARASAGARWRWRRRPPAGVHHSVVADGMLYSARREGLLDCSGARPPTRRRRRVRRSSPASALQAPNRPDDALDDGSSCGDFTAAGRRGAERCRVDAMPE